MPTVPMQKGGEIYDIPAEQAQAAQQAGYELVQDKSVVTQMQDAEGNLYDIPNDKLEAAKAHGLKVQGNMTSQAEALRHVPTREELMAPGAPEEPPGAMTLAKKIWHDMNQGGPADWRNLLNAIGPLAPGINRPVEAMRWGAPINTKTARTLEMFAPSSAPPAFQIRHLGGTPAYIAPVAAAADKAVEGAQTLGAGASSIAGAGAGAAKVAAQMAGRNPGKSALSIALLDEVTGGHLGVSALIKKFFREAFRGEADDSSYNNPNYKPEE